MNEKDKMKEDRLQEDFQYVRETFFPSWDLEKEWRCIYVPFAKKWADRAFDEEIKREGVEHRYPIKTCIMAECDATIGFIRFYRITKNDNIYRILIHEICHAITNDGHGLKWREEMKKAYCKAQENGFKVIARRIERDLSQHEFERQNEEYRKAKKSASEDLARGIEPDLETVKA